MLIKERKEIDGRIYHEVKLSLKLPKDYMLYGSPYHGIDYLFFKEEILRSIKVGEKTDEEILQIALQHQRSKK